MDNKDEIDLIELLKTLWSERKQIITITLAFLLIGVISAILSPIVYTSTTTFINSQSESSGSSSLSGVASLVGINIGGLNSANEIPSEMYPQIGESVEFKRALLASSIDEKKQIKLEGFLAKYHNIDKAQAHDNKNEFFISKYEDELFEIIDEIISISVNLKDGFVSISTEMPESEYAATTCINAREILQNTVINNRIKSAKQKLNYSEKQLKSKRIEFEEIQNKLAYFNDSNLNLVKSSIINEREKLQAEFQIINAVMVELSKQVEQRKLQVSEDTPVFSVIKEASMPVKRSSPKRALMMIVFTLLGFILSVIFILIKKPLISVFSEITS